MTTMRVSLGLDGSHGFVILKVMSSLLKYIESIKEFRLTKTTSETTLIFMVLKKEFSILRNINLSDETLEKQCT